MAVVMAAAAAALLERLKALSCPPAAEAAPTEPPEALRLLCTPSPRRLALLEWICCRVHPPLAACLAALQDAPEDARLRELVKLGAELMLCRADDLPLAEGTAPPQQQLEFITDLLDAAPPPGDESQDPPASSPEALRRAVLSNERFLREVLGSPEGGAALAPPPPPALPTFGPGSPRPRGPRRPGERAPGELGAALEETRRRLELLKAQRPELGGPPGEAPPALLTLGVAARDLGALATAFGATELRDPGGPPGRGAPPTCRPCGPLAPRVHQGLRSLVQSLGAAAQLGDTAVGVTRLAGGAQRQALAARVAVLQRRYRDVGEVPQD
ncbi:HAUS augmin-like complex subunit 7 isoform X2 [Struthio camelus]|uniref:HAUS augmin-like complex subunit 7 isoform X2 n=1 Tax=Struthio camelus TaxID=8801 RepID=UPI0036040A51